MYKIYINKSNGDFSLIEITRTLKEAKKYCRDFVKGHIVFKWGDNDKAQRFSLEVYENEVDDEGNLLDYVYATKTYCEN